MIALANSNGDLIKVLPLESGEFGLHQVFGFIFKENLAERIQRRKASGINTNDDAWICKLKLNKTAKNFTVEPIEGCEVKAAANQAWSITTDRGVFQLMPVTDSKFVPALSQDITESSPLRKSAAIALLLLLAIPLMLGRDKSTEPQVVIEEPIMVKLTPQVQKTVVVPSTMPIELPKTIQTQDKVVKRAIQQNLGFLGLLGNKNITKAIGGATTQLKDSSAGAGAGGKEGSGGEYLTGLGRGVKHATVGNSGVAGLGGIGTKGAGGGAGGYGNSKIGSGEGSSLSKVALSNDLMLEGGLDKAVIQATIAKYLSQVRACYEQGLLSNPALQGQVNMAFQISGTGNVTSANVAKSSLGNSQVESCISTKMMNWTFPKPVGGVNVKVNYPFVLRPVGA
jgi:hypothetical protein